MLFHRCLSRLAAAPQTKCRNSPELVRQLLAAEDVNGRKILNTVGPSVRSTKATGFIYMANFLCFATYGIMINWLYEGHVDLWYGVYGLDDEDEDD